MATNTRWHCPCSLRLPVSPKVLFPPFGNATQETATVQVAEQPDRIALKEAPARITRVDDGDVNDGASPARTTSKDQLLSHVSHELRTPLSAIHQFVTILRDGIAGPLSPEQVNCLDVVFRNVLQLRAMIDDLMEVARADVGKLVANPRPIDITEAVSDAALTLSQRAASRRIRVITEVPGDVPTAYADPSRVLQILLNLVDNGIKFTPEGGRVCLRVAPSTEEPDFLHLSVADTGCGMSPDACIRVFDRLHQEVGPTTSSRKGLGLGLYLCKELVALQGGRIWADSTLGQGTTLHFTVPIFSLPKLVTPIIAPDGALCPTVALVAVDVSSANGLAGEALDQILRSARRVVQRCMLPDLDVQLPQMARHHRGETLLVVAATNRAGVNVLARRIHNQLARSPEFDHSQIDVRLSTTLVETSADGEDLDELGIALIVRRISVWINELRERFSDGEETDTDH